MAQLKDLIVNGPSRFIGTTYINGFTLNKTVPADAVFTDTWRPVTDSVATTNSSTCASATAVKTAYDKAVSAWASHTTLAANKINAIPVTHRVVTCPISAAGSFAISGTMAAGQVIHVIVQNTTTSAKTVTIPNSGSYVSLSGTSLSVPASSYAEINVVYNGTKMFVRTAY